jgi:hypothetical protein
MASQKGTSRLAQVARPARKMLSTWRYNEILLDRIDNTQYIFNKQIKTKQNKEREREIYIYCIYIYIDITRVMIYIGDMKRYRQKYFLYTVYNNKQIGGIMEYRYHKIPVVPHKAVAEVSKIGNL